MFLLHYLLNKGIMSPETMSPSTDILDGDKIVSCLSKKYYEDMIPINVFPYWKDIVSVFCKYYDGDHVPFTLFTK